MADKTYGLYPFTWNAPQGNQPGYHSAPSGSLCVLDLRSLPNQSTQGQSAGYGFFSWLNSPPADLIVLGVGDCRTIVATPAMRNELKNKLALATPPSGATLIDLVNDVLGPLAVPDGSTGVRPNMPTTEGDLEIHLASHSLVKSTKLNLAQLLAANPTGHANKIRDVIRLDLDIADKAGKLGEALGHWLMRCGYSRAEVKAGAPGKKTEYERLCSAKVRAKYGNNLKPKEPKTQLTETWPTNSAIETGQVYTWTTPIGAMEVVGGRLRSMTNFNWAIGRCESAVSSTNHYAQVLFHAIGQPGQFGAAARVSVDGADMYACQYHLAGAARRIYKSVTGTWTQLDSGAYTFAANDVFKIKANGSTLTGTVTGETDLTTTDTAHSGGLCGGVAIYDDTNAHSFNEWGTVVIDDELPAAPVAAFSGTPLTGTAPLSVAFTDSSTNTPTSLLWEKSSNGGSSWANFASGPTTQNPTESLTVGTWAIRLTATNAGGSDAEEKLAYVVVSAAAGGAGVSAQMLVEGWL